MQNSCNILAYSMEKQNASKLGPAVRRFLYIYIYIPTPAHALTHAYALRSLAGRGCTAKNASTPKPWNQHSTCRLPYRVLNINHKKEL